MYINVSWGKARDIINKSLWNNYSHFTCMSSIFREITRVKDKNIFYGGVGFAISPFNATTWNDESISQTFMSFFLSIEYFRNCFFARFSYFLE